MPSPRRAKSINPVDALVKSAVAMARAPGRAFDAQSRGTYGDSSVRDISAFRAAWRSIELPIVFQKCRELSKLDGFVSTILFFKKLIFLQGVRFLVDGEELKRGNASSNSPQVRRLELYLRITRDVFHEFLVCDNAAVFWTENPTDTDAESEATLPLPIVFNTEDIRFDNAFGIPVLKWRTPRTRKLDEEMKLRVGARYAEAIESGKDLTLGEDGEQFRVLTLEKLGNGLAMPRLRAAFENLSVLSLLTKGDWNAAWTAKDVIRQFKKGHEITTGNLAGMPMHFLKPEERDLIKKGLEGKAGAYDVITNFDLEISYPQPKMDFFKPDKYEGTLDKLAHWAGPLGLLLHGRGQSLPADELLALLNAEADFYRETVGIFIEEILGSEDFDRDQKKEVRVCFGEVTASSLKNALAMVTAGGANGWMAPQTAQRLLRLDSAEQRKLMREAHEHREDFTPPFEAKQGLLTEGAVDETGGPAGGRPAET